MKIPATARIVSIALLLAASGAAQDSPHLQQHELLDLSPPPPAGTVKVTAKISDTEGGFDPGLKWRDSFGLIVSTMGDFDGDGITDLLASTVGDDDGGTAGIFSDHGAVWILLLNADGSVREHHKISDTEGNFTGVLEKSDWFGYGVEGIGDLDGDGVFDIAAGAGGDDDGRSGAGAVYILFMNPDGTVRQHRKISEESGGFEPGQLGLLDHFGFAMSSLGDLDGDGITDLAVSAMFDDAAGFDAGAIYILFLRANGNVLSQRKITTGKNGFSGALDAQDTFGRAMATLGDVDGDGVVDLAAGAFGDGDGGPGTGAVWILFLRTDGRVKNQQKISALEGGFPGEIPVGIRFGSSVEAVGDLDADGVPDMIVGGSRGPLFTLGSQALWTVFLNRDGTVKAARKIAPGVGGFTGVLEDGDRFGSSITRLGDLDGDGIVELAVGANGDDDGGLDRGAIWMLFLNGARTANWQDLGHGLAGSLGVPVLVGEGPLQGGDDATLTLSNARPDAMAALIFGFEALNAPYAGGILVPTPDTVVKNLPLDGNGRRVMQLEWPPGLPAGETGYVQMWIQDPTGPGQLTASNALAAIQP